MKIFEQEKKDGLEENIKASASFTYACSVESSDVNIKKDEIKALAGVEDKDLYYTQSILVSTDWNKNDDIFDPKEVWAAKDTPSHKPTNIEHQESKIVGHIINNWPITEDGVIISNDTPVENLPSKYQVLTASVIYTGFTDPELRERTSDLIQEIEAGTKYVSMECFFNGFDYGLQDKSTGELKLLPREEATAYLTKHLRAYGGSGEFENHKIGRVLRNITFSGKGFVDKPANPESIIFQKENFKFLENQKTPENEKEGVSPIQATQEATMSSENLNPNDKVEAMNDCTELVKEAYAARDEFKAQASELETSLKSQQETLAEVKAALEALEAEKVEAMKMADEDKKKKEEEMKKMKAELDEALEAIAAYKDKEEEMKKKDAMMKRKASLLEAGLDEESASSSVEKFENLDDEAFANMVSLLAAMKPKKEEKKEEEEAMMMKKKASEEELTEALENVEVTEEANLTVGSDESEDAMTSTRAALIDFVYNRLGKTLDKGE
jgi:hypothetical protein